MITQYARNWARLGTVCGAALAVLLFSASAFAESSDRGELREQARPAATERVQGAQGVAVSEEEQRFYKGMPDSFREVYDPEGKLPVEEPVDARLERIGDRTRLPEEVRPFIVDVTFDGAVPTLFFEVADENGAGVADIESVRIGVTAVKLAPGSDGKTDHWQGYFYRDDNGVTDAQVSTYGGGTLENLGGGNYSFTLDVGLDEVSDIPFEPQLTHRMGIELRNVEILGQQLSNSQSGDSWFEIQPATGETEGIPTRRIATQENCVGCHASEEFSFHGGPRKTVEYCVTCHTDGDIDGGTGNSISFTTMVHAIHSPELQDEPYAVVGFGDRLHSYEGVTYPQDVRNCTTCHSPDNEATPQAEWVDDRGTAEQCASCHTNLAFDDTGLTNGNRQHAAGAQPNSTCAACHSKAGLMESNLEAHVIPSQAAAKRFQYNVLEVTNTSEGDSPVVTFSVTDPTNDDAPYDMTTHPAFSGSGEASVNISFVWPNADFTNVANDDGTDVTGRPVAQARRIAVAPGSGFELPTGVFDNGDGTYTLDSSMLNPPIVIPSTTPALGSGSILMEGHPAGDFSGQVGVFEDSVPVTSALVPFAINDEEPAARRVVVSLEKCQDCHNVNDGLAFHGGNRADNNEACASCHNPNSTDLYRRPADPDGVANGVSEATVDGLEEATVNYAYMIHAIHAPEVRETEYTAYGFGGTPHSYGEVTYPKRDGDCLACHVEGTYYGAPEGALGTTVNSGATVLEETPQFFLGAAEYAPSEEVATNWNDDNKFSPQAAACVACHDSEIAVEHMSVRGEGGISFGNSFLDNPDPFDDPDTQERINNAGPENCVFCHGQGAFADVDEAHGLK
ncbi:OmcA/MtrC family decaheme c-type cytochrome [Wenzhouxiangella limi]|uniref:OmcA/MtrC family decaheme c-type cytochrome n=1 Tax=Wenzhouxiangella limi TaxID=2707351 RepID=A0A845V0H3_9GAMM|nr:OmcA/MtrC family decaheme c-type cytochrome [Wenzhouxiangella limi]NDY95710.1 OmcA/MtrC family decaheme c-type cytochrome [Wenzhouxiangella limi]